MDEDTPTENRGTEPTENSAHRPEAGMADRMRKAREASQRSRIDDARRRAPKASVIRYTMVVVLAVASLGMVVYFTGTSSAHESAVRSNLAEIRELEKALAESEVAAESVPDADELRPAFSTAAAKGEELATLQNEMGGLNFEVRDRSAALGEYGVWSTRQRSTSPPALLAAALSFRTDSGISRTSRERTRRARQPGYGCRETVGSGARFRPRPSMARAASLRCGRPAS